MKRISVIALVVLLTPCLVASGIFFASDLKLRNFKDPLPFVGDIPTDVASIEYGRHVARIRGCFGCHGQHLEGKVFTDQWPWVKRAVAPNLAIYAREHSSIQLEAAIRHGIGADGRAFWSMPSYNWTNLSDSDLASLVAFLQNAEVRQSTLPQPKLGWEARLQIATGAAMHMAEWASIVPELNFQNHREPAMQRGEYLAMTMCNECHGLDLRGASNPDGIAPDLAVLDAYTETDFRQLMETGIATGERGNLNLMSMVARDRFAHLTEEEINSLYYFLRTLPGQPVPPNVPWRTIR